MAQDKALVDVPAPAWLALTSLVIDLTALVGAGYATRWLTIEVQLPDTLSWILTAVVVTVTFILQVWPRRRQGSSLGHVVLGLRAIDPHTQLPGRRPGLRAVRIRRGTDPLHLSPRPVILDWERPEPVPTSPPKLVGTLDDGSIFQLPLPCVIGRFPKASDAFTKVAVTDIRRSISRTHLAMWLDGGQLIVQDLGSRSGSAHLTPTAEVPITPHEPFRLPLPTDHPTTLRLGARTLDIEAIPSHTGAA
ncbi:RDD family protein [Arachnia propionica]|uniref:RDD family protein n=1 Tax=Arachnia propionica TaxID=1750 RepID=UPI00163A680E|nr:RDD family protein [Arachnia propionica]